MSAFYDHVREFLQNRLQAFDPTIDLSPDGPAFNEIIEPLIARLGTDPFDIDIKEFIYQRLTESFPDLVVDVGEMEDLVINPLSLLLEPFKQELNKIELAQSLRNAALLDDDEVDALAANWFEEREEGNFSSGTVRLYFVAPQNVTVTSAKQVNSKSGLHFFPVQDESITAAQMLFNREGDLYYVDINVAAEEPGDEYNIEAQSIISIDDVTGVVKVTNLFPFTGGVPREDNETFVARIEQALTERSLVTKRGVTTRIHKLFNSVRAINIIGAGEEGMNRDILKGTGEGFIHLTGECTTFGNWVFIPSVFYKDTGPQKNIVAAAGDTLRFHKTIGLDPNRTVTSCKITQVLWNVGDLYLIQVDKDLGKAIPGFVAILKPGFITISEIPGGMLNASVPDNKVHLGGHSDIYIRPSDDKPLAVAIKNISDNVPVLNLTKGILTNGSNLFSTAAPDPIDLAAAGVLVGDTVVIETGTQAGTYKVLEVGANLRLDNIFTANEANLRCRIVRSVTVNLNNPKNIKLPFNVPVNDLNTVIGSNLFTLGTINIQTFGAVVGDIIELLDGPDAGEFTITGFDNVLGGQGPIVDRPAGATSSNLRYRVYTLQTGLDFPIVRVKDIEVLDSSNQTTGIKVPYGDAVDIRALCDFEAPNDPRTILDKRAFMVPDALGFWEGLAEVFGVAAPNVDARYSQRLIHKDGRVRTFPADAANPIITTEINIPPFAFDGKKNVIMGLVTEKDPNFNRDPANNPQTSPLAEAKAGDTITVLSGPNAGTYLIADVRIFELWGRSFAGHNKIAFIQIDGELPFDPIRTCIDLISFGAGLGSGVAPISAVDLLKIIEWSTDWFNGSGFYEAILIPRLRDTLQFLGFPAVTNNTRELLNTISMTGYTVGPSATGMLRCYFKDPVSVDLFTDSIAPTLFEKISADPVPKRARIANLKSGQVLPQAFDDSSIDKWLRIGSTKSPVDTSYYLTSGATFAKRGVRTGDVLEYYPAVNDLSSRHLMNTSFICCTQIGSNEVELIMTNTRNNSTAIRAGMYLFLDSGPDAGAYTITEVLSDIHPNYKVKINKSLTFTTLTNPGPPSTAATVTGGSNTLSDPGFVFAAGKWVTIYAANNATIITSGNDVEYLGTFRISGPGLGLCSLDRTAFFPANATVLYVMHDPPAVPPAETSGGGKEISTQYTRFRMYSSIKSTRTITINWSVIPNPLDPTCTDQIILNDGFTTVAQNVNFSHKSPIRVTRPLIKKFSSTDMSKSRIGGLYYLDIPVIAIGLGPDFLFPEDTTFKFAGRYQVYGYKYLVHDENLSYSVKEITDLVFPSTILPVGSTPTEDNEIKIAGQNIQIIYDNAALIDDLQRFFDSPLDRVVNSNPLVRHFLPAYVLLEATYSGGSDTSVVAKDLIDLIKDIDPRDNELRVDAITRILQKRGARQIVLPIEVIALVHGLDRKIRGVRSKDGIGLDFPVFKGVNKMIYFIPGPDSSTLDVRPDGEQVFLSRG